ncbi:glutaredoxin domain-containing protein [Streptomyces tailanensis]|uniref:glutaredoxin domain-containing protein n=1 Tax=Streptomyces tailanensis TaxID=2569858 RepID=UPI00319E7697
MPISPRVVVYWRPGCPFCSSLRRGLRRSGVEFTERNIWEDQKATAFVRSVAHGNETVPTVTVAGRATVNPSARQVLAGASEHAPQTDSEPRRGLLGAVPAALSRLSEQTRARAHQLAGGR